MTKVGLLDVAMSTDNAGDQIITDAIEREVLDHLGSRLVARVPTHVRPTLRDIVSLSKCNVVFLGGSNILSSRMENHHQWRLWPDLMLAIRKKVVFCGVGWNQYSDVPSSLTKHALRWMALPGALHSARDSYTAAKVASIGLAVTNTGCPTMWGLDRIPTMSTNTRPIVTITDYRRDHVVDRAWLATVVAHFGEARLVPMGLSDVEYARELNVAGVEVLPRGLETLDRVLTDDVVHIGTRLHAGIRTLQRRHPSLVFSVDNRAVEISNDTGMPIADRRDTDSLVHVIGSSFPSVLNIAHEQIGRWKDELGLLPDPKKQSA